MWSLWVRVTKNRYRKIQNAYRVVVRKPERKRLFASPTCRWEGYIKRN
jgi:hypothetical protein